MDFKRLNADVDRVRLGRAKLSLAGLSIGDALGEISFSAPSELRQNLARYGPPPGTWLFTDYTEMALGMVETLVRHGRIDQDMLARRFVSRFAEHPDRGYGRGARHILEAIQRGEDWRDASARAFGAAGSMGNGASMRVAPLGAWFADDLDAAVENAALSAVVTHSHPEGQAGAIAVAVAAAVAYRERESPPEQAVGAIWDEVLARTPAGETARQLRRAADLGDVGVDEASKQLGNGFLVTAPDTVPFAIWSAARHLNDFSEAIIATISVGGDTDTNAAIVGGIVALYAGADTIPAAWKSSCETFLIQIPTLRRPRRLPVELTLLDPKKKPDPAVCPRDFCFLWYPARTNDQGVIEWECGNPFSGVCTRLDPINGDRDWYENDQPNLDAAGLPWFYFYPSAAILAPAFRDRYRRESDALWGEGHDRETP